MKTLLDKRSVIFYISYLRRYRYTFSGSEEKSRKWENVGHDGAKSLKFCDIYLSWVRLFP